MSRFLSVLMLVGGLLVSIGAADADGTPSQTNLIVPINTYAVLHFGQPVVKAVLPPDAPLKGKPYYLSNSTVLLLMFEKSKHPVQAIVQLKDGTTHVLSLQPRSGANAQINVPDTGARTTQAAIPAVPPSRNPAAGVVPVFSALVSDKVPSGWSARYPDGIPKLRYERLTAIPVAAWEGGDGLRVVQYTVQAVPGKASDIDPSQFYLPGVRAAMLTGDQVYGQHTVTLYLLRADDTGSAGGVEEAVPTDDTGRAGGVDDPVATDHPGPTDDSDADGDQ